MSDAPILNWNAKQKPWPTSYDGTPAQRCDRQGRHNTRGRYITWEEKRPTDTLPTRKIAKLTYPKVKQEPLDHEEAKRETAENPRYDLLLPKPRMRMRTRLQKIFAKLGVGYLDAQNCTHVQQIDGPACWGTGQKEGDEFIFIHPYFLMQRMTWARFLILHEIGHRALYRGRDHLADHQLRNVVFDICINRILAANTTGRPNKTWHRFCEWIYPPESKETVLALCNAALTEDEVRKLEAINPVYAQIWRQLYELQYGDFKYTNPRTGRQATRKLNGIMPFDIKNMNPDDLYFRLRSQLTEQDRQAMQAMGHGKGQEGDQQGQGMNPFGDHDTEVRVESKARGTATIRGNANGIASDSARKMEQAARRAMVPRRFQGANWKAWSDCRTDFWDTWVKKPEDLTDPGLEEYARRITTQKKLDNVVGNVATAFESEVTQDPYPHHLSEEGLLLAVAGLRPPRFPFFQNVEGPHGKRRVVVYFDLSPSMTVFFPYMSYMCDQFEDKMDMAFARNEYGDQGTMTFAGSVRILSERELQKMRLGDLKAGASTSFDAMVEHTVEQIQTEDVDAVICFTDGESGLSQDNIDAFNASGKRMYRIYFQPDHPRYRGRDIESPLDELEGVSYTITAPPTDRF